MSSDLTYKLSHFEVPPPSSAWKQIRARLDEEYDIAEIHLAMKMDDTAIIPPAFVWDRIQSGLAENKTRIPARIVPLTYRRMAIAASIIGVIGFAAWYMLTFSNAGTPTKGVTVTAAVGTTVAPGIEPKADSAHPAVIASNTTDAPTVKRPLPVRRNRYPSPPKTTNRPAPLFASAFSTVVPDRPISIQAPSIRDENGNIVMDVSLLKSSDDDRYITVTSPNGQQTRISDKFINILHYLNAQDNDTNLQDTPERLVWKQRILEWKNKLIQQGAFFPSNNNFLGIMELKDMIQDK